MLLASAGTVNATAQELSDVGWRISSTGCTGLVPENPCVDLFGASACQVSKPTLQVLWTRFIVEKIVSRFPKGSAEDLHDS